LALLDRYIGGTKGSHLVLDHPELREAIGKNEFFFENKDGRIVLIFPVFTTRSSSAPADIPIENPDEARCTPEEEQYFIDLVSRVFPTIQGRPEHIVFRFSGVRPLEYMQPRPPARSPATTASRKTWLGHPGLLAGRRQVDELPRLRRAGDRQNAGVSRATAPAAAQSAHTRPGMTRPFRIIPP
jgi:glycerol-3-phosphate dehydrogenase